MANTMCSNISGKRYWRKDFRLSISLTSTRKSNFNSAVRHVICDIWKKLFFSWTIFYIWSNIAMNIKKHKAESKVKPHAVSKKEAPTTEKKHVAYSFSDTVSYVSDFEMVYNYKPYYTDDISLLTQSKRGLNAKAALDFLTLSGFTQDEFQETFKTTVKTIQNHVTRELTLDAAISEKLLKSFALFDKGSTIFGSASNFHQW